MTLRTTPQLLRAVQFKHHTSVRGPRKKAIYTVHLNGVLIESFESTTKTPRKAYNASMKLCERLCAALAPIDFVDNVNEQAVRLRNRDHWVKRRFTRVRPPMHEVLKQEAEEQSK